MNEISRTKKIIAAVIFSLVVFLVFLNKEKTYESETDILIVGKNPAITENIGATIKTIRQILGTYSFYKEVENGIGGIDSIDDGMPEYRQKALWNDVIDVDQAGGSFVFSLKNFDKNETISRDLNTETVKTLILSIGKYYDIKTDIDVRIIDGPITKQISTRNLLALFAWSLLFGILFYVIIFLFIPWFYLKEISEKIEPSSRKIGSFARKMNFGFPKPKGYEPEAPYAFPVENPKVAPEMKAVPKKEDVKQEEFKPKPVQDKASSDRKSGSPDNLPVSEEIPAFILKSASSEKGEPEPVIKDKDLSREATPEEVKERLNRLLGGDL